MFLQIQFAVKDVPSYVSWLVCVTAGSTCFSEQRVCEEKSTVDTRRETKIAWFPRPSDSSEP